LLILIWTVHSTKFCFTFGHHVHGLTARFSRLVTTKRSEYIDFYTLTYLYIVHVSTNDTLSAYMMWLLFF